MRPKLRALSINAVDDGYAVSDPYGLSEHTLWLSPPALFLASRMGSTRPNMAGGYELEVIAMVVLGGVSTSGGKGSLAGPLLAVFVIGFLNYGLGLVNVQAQVLLIIIGLLLILSVLALNLRTGKRHRRPAA